MILVDFNQVCISNFMAQVGNHTNMKIEEDMIRHMVLNTIRMVRTKFKEEYGEVVICADSRKYWRREVFPYYKASRKNDRAASDVDWTTLFETLSTLREELITNFPYKVVMVEGAEADDVIATLAKKYSIHEKVLIVSSDKDFMQLQKHQGVDQYSLLHKKKLRTPDPYKFIAEHILKGDRGDGIPNVMSDDDTFVVGKRQKPLRQGTIDSISAASAPEEWSKADDRFKRNYHRNRQLIDLDYIPAKLAEDIVQHYDDFQPRPRTNLLNYFIKHKLRNLTDSIGEF